MLRKNKALEVLSRGQQKILVSALKIAQGQLLGRTRGNHSIYLIDDLPAELDADNRQRVLQYLSGLGGQLFVTSVAQDALRPCLQESSNLTSFHVERGKITASVD